MRYTGYAIAVRYFRDHCKSPFVTIDWVIRCIAVGSLMYGRENTEVVTLQSRS